jgi:hypothetical protein
MIQASTSAPSGDTAVKRSGSDSSISSVKEAPTAVSLRGPENTSAGAVGVPAVWTTSPSRQSKPLIQS